MEQLTIINKNADKLENMLASGKIDSQALEQMGEINNAFEDIATSTEVRGPEDYDLEDVELSTMFYSNTAEDMVYNSSHED